MNSTDVEGWFKNEDLKGSVQLVYELPAFTDSINWKRLNYQTKGLSIINNYGGVDKKKEYLNGEIKIVKSQDNFFLESSINLITEKPNTKQQIILDKNSIPSFSFAQYQELEKTVDSTREAEKDLIVTALTETINSRDSIWEIANQRIEDSLRLHPYTGKFRFWISDIDKARIQEKPILLQKIL